MTELVFIDSWQLQCCGEEFGVGSHISCTVEENGDQAWLSSVVGSELAQRIRYHEDHHDTARGPTSIVRGVVTSIRVVTYGLEAIPGEPRGFRPGPGTQELHPVRVIDKWAFAPKPRSPTEPPTSALGGWIVELALDDVTEP